MRDSNSRHLRCKRSALPTELITRDAACSQACGRVQEGLSDFLEFYSLADPCCPVRLEFRTLNNPVLPQI